MQTDQWKYILQSGEEILWQGQPDAKLVLRIDQPMQFMMGLFFMGFSLFWMAGAAQAGGVFWMFGLIFFFTGLGNSVGAPFVKSFVNARTWYTLTNRRAYIATSLPWKSRSLKSWAITPDNTLNYQPGAPGSIFFAIETRRRNKSDYETEIGFERIYDAPQVYQMMREIQDQDTGTLSDTTSAVTLNAPDGTHS